MKSISWLTRIAGDAYVAVRGRLITPISLWLRWKFLGIWYAMDALGRLPAAEIPDALRRFGATVGERVSIRPGLRIDNPRGALSNLVIGNDVQIGPNVCVDVTGKLRIEDDVIIGPRVCILSHMSAGDRPLRGEYPMVIKNVTIGEGARIGTGSVILQGVTIGRRAVIGVQSLVNRDIEDGAVASGMPARTARAPVKASAG